MLGQPYVGLTLCQVDLMSGRPCVGSTFCQVYVLSLSQNLAGFITEASVLLVAFVFS
jgi:hypothetical protein